MQATIIIPFHRNLDQLARAVAAARQSMQDAEILIAADGAVENCRPTALEHHAEVVTIIGPSGPATARNRAASAANGDILVFVDSDVVVSPGAISGLCGVLEADRSLAAVFGAYDLAPAEPDFMSQFKNLSHAYVHEIGAGEASTFWAGLGAIRASVFREVGGFDERFRQPSVEDIDLGYRVTARGGRILLDPRFRGKHLKRWTFTSSVMTDIFARGVPWTQLIHRSGRPRNELNLSKGLKLSVVCAYLVPLFLLGAFISPWAIAGSLLALGTLIALNSHYYAWLTERRGFWFGLRSIPVHFVHHLSNGISFAYGTLLFTAGRLGLKVPGALPSMSWRGRYGAPGESPVSRV